MSSVASNDSVEIQQRILKACADSANSLAEANAIITERAARKGRQQAVDIKRNEERVKELEALIGAEKLKQVQVDRKAVQARGVSLQCPLPAVLMTPAVVATTVPVVVVNPFALDVQKAPAAVNVVDVPVARCGFYGWLLRAKVVVITLVLLVNLVLLVLDKIEPEAYAYVHEEQGPPVPPAPPAPPAPKPTQESALFNVVTATILAVSFFLPIGF